MKVYVVLADHTMDWCVLCVFATREAAETYLAQDDVAMEVQEFNLLQRWPE